MTEGYDEDSLTHDNKDPNYNSDDQEVRVSHRPIFPYSTAADHQCQTYPVWVCYLAWLQLFGKRP